MAIILSLTFEWKVIRHFMILLRFLFQKSGFYLILKSFERIRLSFKSTNFCHRLKEKPVFQAYCDLTFHEQVKVIEILPCLDTIKRLHIEINLCMCDIKYGICNDSDQNYFYYKKWLSTRNEFYQQNKIQYSMLVPINFKFYNFQRLMLKNIILHI